MKIAVGNSRMDKKWKNKDISWEDLCARCSSTIRTTETVEEYRKLKKGQQDAIKDVGGFVGGHLREGRRKNGMVACRSLLTLDMDYGTPDIWDKIVMLHDFKCCVYSTHKHTPEHPRLRLLLPLTREVSEDEYPAVARMVAKEIGIDLFDDTTYEPASSCTGRQPRQTASSSIKRWTAVKSTRTSTLPNTQIGGTPRCGRYPVGSPKRCTAAFPSRPTR